MKKLLFSVSLLSSLQVFAQTPQLVHDFTNTSPGGEPRTFTLYNNKLFMAAKPASIYYKIYSYNGTGTPTMTINLDPIIVPYDLTKMGVFNNKLYFNAEANNQGRELHMYDGTNPATMIADINPGPLGSYPNNFTVLNNKLYFTASDAAHGNELWMYDGMNPPVCIDINPTADGNPSSLCVYNNKLYFHGVQSGYNEELFVLDPTNNNVTMVQDIEPGANASKPEGMMVYNNKMYFIARTQQYGAELYSYDGTNVTRLTDIGNGPDGGIKMSDMLMMPVPLIEYNGKLHFSACTDLSFDYEPWKYDLTTNTPSLLHQVSTSGPNVQTNWWVKYNGRLYFNANDYIHGNELWVYDGTTTSLVADLMPGTDPGLSSYTLPVVYNGKLYFQGEQSASNWELFSLSTTAGIKNESLKGEIVLSPNPTADVATLKFSLQQSMRLQVVVNDGTGKNVLRSSLMKYAEGESEMKLSMKEQPAGPYLYYVLNDDGVVMVNGKIQKQ